jgi:hypothetical protein
VFQNRDSNEFVISFQLSDGCGLNFDTGPLMHLSHDKMERDCAQLIAQHCERFDRELFSEPSELKTVGVEKRRSFYAKHRNVLIYRPTPDRLIVWPSRSVKRRKDFFFVALDIEERIELEWPATSENCFKAILRALEKAR